MKGWERVMVDKCVDNECSNVQSVNMPGNFNDTIERSSRMRGGPECDTFVYAAYLPPGLHKFVIYCPDTKRMFCKDEMVNLSASDHHYPEYPGQHITQEAQPGPKRLNVNVWRKWKEDTKATNTAGFDEDTTDVTSF